MKKFLFFIFFCSVSSGFSQSVVIDDTFNPGGVGFTGLNRRVFESVIQPDGKIISVGHFNSYNGVASSKVVRLNPDGSLDTSFSTPTSIIGDVFCVKLDNSGNIYLGGSFTQFNGVAKRGLVRLSPTGVLDTTFNVDFSINNPYNAVRDIAFLSNGEIFIGGTFKLNNPGLGSNYCFAKLNSDGVNISPPETHDFEESANVNCIYIQSDGKILVGGSASNPNQFQGLVRLNQDCSADSDFNTTCPVYGTVSSFYIQPDNKIIFSGCFATDITGLTLFLLGRLYEDGSFDASFTFYPVSPSVSADISCVLPYDNGYLASGIIPGDDLSVYLFKNIIKVGFNGEVAPEFSVGQGFYASSSQPFVSSINLQQDGKIIASGNFAAYNSQVANTIVRLIPGVSDNEDFPEMKHNVFLYKDNSDIIAKSEMTNISSLVVYDMSGRRVFFQENINDSSYRLVGLPEKQILFVKLTLEGGIIHDIKIQN